jgi:uncharacterized protein YlaN (UPF0358 family)
LNQKLILVEALKLAGKSYSVACVKKIPETKANNANFSHIPLVKEFLDHQFFWLKTEISCSLLCLCTLERKEQF